MGGDGADQFVMGRCSAIDTIADFRTGLDRIRLDGVTVEKTYFYDANGDGRGDMYIDLSHGSGVILLGIERPVPESALFI